MDGFRRKGNIGFDYASLCERVASRLARHVALSYCNTARYSINLASNKFCFWHIVCNVYRMQRALRPRPVQPTPAGAIRQEGNRAATGRLRSRLRTFRRKNEAKGRGYERGFSNQRNERQQREQSRFANSDAKREDTAHSRKRINETGATAGINPYNSITLT